MTKEQFEKKERLWKEKNQKLFDENVALKQRIDEVKMKINVAENLSNFYSTELEILKKRALRLEEALLKIIDKI